MSTYIFTSQRLGFREWRESDIDFLQELNTNSSTMKYFPIIPSRAQNRDFLNRMSKALEERSFCYFLVELKDSHIPIGFTGLHKQEFESKFTPAVDIGWRLLPNYWGKGFATEGALASLNYGFNTLKLNSVISIAPQINKPSLAVMTKIGMKMKGEFMHPNLKTAPLLEPCYCFEIHRNEF